jgi:hypothetical protein
MVGHLWVATDLRRRPTGICQSEWSGRYWARWNDAIAEAGYTPNEMNTAIDTDELLAHLASLVRELGHFPTAPELKMKFNQRVGFPAPNTFQRFGNKSSRIALLAEFCGRTESYEDVAAVCAPLIAQRPQNDEDGDGSSSPVGFVYLVKNGRHHKLGRTTDVGRRTYDINLQLPEKSQLVHSFATDDPVGIERYWHERFADRRANGEWFLLTKADIAAFKARRRFM